MVCGRVTGCNMNQTISKGKLLMLRRLYNAGLPIILTACFLLTFASAHGGNEAKQCDAVIPVSVPDLTCDIVDNEQLVVKEVPKHVDTAGHCGKPEDLYTRCVYHSRLGKVKTGNPDVEILYSCRKANDGSTHQNDTSPTYYDIAIIQHDKKTGNTCFYQHLGNIDGSTLPAPKTSTNFWTSSVNYCSQCHANGPFIRTPHYEQVTYDNKPLIPSLYGLKKYRLANTTNYEIFNVHKRDNACIDCHNIGAYRTGENQQIKMGELNQLAAGTVQSLRHDRSPTSSGYDDFMAKKVGGHANAVKVLKDLETCLGSNRKSPECGLESIDRASVCESIDYGGEPGCFWMENTTKNWCWVKTPIKATTKERCMQLDSCNGGGGQSGGGCYKWAYSSTMNRFAW